MESKLNNLNFYDQVVGTVVANVISETARTDNQIYLKWFDPSSPSHMVYFNGALIAAAIFKNKINLDMPSLLLTLLRLCGRSRSICRRRALHP